MSRTNKDKPDRLRFPKEFQKPHERELSKKEQDTVWDWSKATPSWWTNLFMNRPQRREAQQWERDIQKINDLEELEELDKPNVSKKPHKYYW
jgi:hypothetical protein